MTQEQKELLLKDISARLPYKVFALIFNEYDDYRSKIEGVDIDGFVTDFEGSGVEVEYIRPYLFPMSSMTEEQQIEANVFDDMDMDILSQNIDRNRRDKTNIPTPTYNYIDWLNKNHFDYRGLIEKGLAIDATNLNIY